MHPRTSHILEKLGCRMGVFQNILETVDTRNMHQYIIRGQNPTKLQTVMTYLDLLRAISRTTPATMPSTQCVRWSLTLLVDG